MASAGAERGMGVDMIFDLDDEEEEDDGSL